MGLALTPPECPGRNVMHERGESSPRARSGPRDPDRDQSGGGSEAEAP
jgi:hypothetical protein